MNIDLKQIVNLCEKINKKCKKTSLSKEEIIEIHRYIDAIPKLLQILEVTQKKIENFDKYDSHEDLIYFNGEFSDLAATFELTSNMIRKVICNYAQDFKFNNGADPNDN